jgi:gluconolactonase
MNAYRYFLPAICLLWACQSAPTEPKTEAAPANSSIDAPGRTLTSLDPRFDAIVAPGTEIEVLAEGFDWSEGPLWVAEGGYLLFTDIPPNSIFKWKEGEGKSLYLKPAGLTGESERGGEVGANGLLLDAEGQLVLCQHGNRQMARMDAPLSAPQSKFTALADRYDGKRFNSPNDATFHSNGDLYFTDPPYGLEFRMDDPAKEIPFQGVYLRRTKGEVVLLTDELSRPNGIAFSPDESILYVANSDPKRAIWMAYPVLEGGTLGEGSVFADATSLVGKANPGMPDGLKVRADGTIFATGPGGVWVFSPEGEKLGVISSGQPTSNCALGNDGAYLYLTADMYLMRVALTQ